MRDNCLVLSMVLCLGTPAVSQTASPAVSDPAPDAAHPAAMDAFVLPAPNGSMNALMYQAAGGGPHPTLLLLHGFPGNEQNLDLAQAARRAGWNVLTLHYRGSWGSRGVFSFANAATDARIALRYLRRPEIVAQYRIDPRRIAIAGHSMGGFMAADAAADDKGVVGLFLIDAWNIGAEASQLGTSVGREVWHKKAVRNLPPLAGTSEEALLREMLAGQDRFDLNSRIAAFGNRPLAIYGASRGGGEANGAYVAAAKAAGNTIITSAIWPTDHSFSDKRVALAKALVAWLDTLPARSR
jgi:pimeloyl-ACP methyl ester carboxylesterase